MIESSALYTWLLAVSAGLSAWIIALVWHRRHVPGAMPVIIFSLALCEWSATYAVYWQVSDPSEKLLWLNLTYLGVVTAPGAFLAFMLYQTQQQRWLNRRTWLLLLVEPLLTLALIATDRWHGLFFAGKQTPASSVILDGGLFFWIQALYSYALLLISLELALHAVIRGHSIFRRQVAQVLAAAALPWIANVISLMGLNPLRGLDLTPVAFMVTCLIFAHSLLRDHLLDLVPIARNKVIHDMPEPIFVVDAQNRIVDVNVASTTLLAMLGHAVDQPLIGVPIPSLLPQWTAWLARNTSSYLTIDSTSSSQQRILKPSISPIFGSSGQLQGRVLVLVDMTEHKHLEEQLQQNLSYMQTIFDSVSDAVFICDGATGRILDCNRRVAELYRVSRESILATPENAQFDSGVEPYTHQKFVQLLDKVRVDGPQMVEWHDFCHTGETFWLDLRVRHTHIEGQERFLVTANDVTERKRAQQRAFELGLERERVQVLKSFIHDASHEFRTPLASILTGLYLLARAEDTARRDARIDAIAREVDTLTRLVDMLVLLSSLESGAPLKPVPTDLNDLIGREVEVANHQHKALRIETDLSPDIGVQAVDPTYFAEALRQILDNAVRNTPEGGVIQVSSHLEDHQARIRVKDTGCGIDAEALPHIFERFYRADTAHSTPGIGLGLPIAQRILEAHGGFIDVESEPAQGSEFMLVLPLANAPNSLLPVDSGAPIARVTL